MTKCHTKTFQSVFSRVHLVSVDATAENNSEVTVKKNLGKAAQNYDEMELWLLLWSLNRISKKETKHRCEVNEE